MRRSSVGGAPFICMVAEYTLGGPMRSRSSRSSTSPQWSVHLRVFLALALACLLAAAGRPAPAAAAAPPHVAAKAWVVMDQRTGVVLDAHDPDRRLPMASTTKIMTGLVVLEHVRNLQAMVTARRDAVGVGEDEIYLHKGEKLTVDQLLKATLIQSANDAAADLADYVAGSQKAFVAMMNAKAAQLGLTNTHYMNPHGLDQPGHHSSAMDLARLARVAMADRRFAGYVRTYETTIPWKGRSYRRVLVSHNTLLHDYPWVDGVKTGWTDPAGYCVVASGRYGGRRFIVSVLGAPSEAARVAGALKLFKYGATFYGVRRLVGPGSVEAHVKVPYHDEGLDLVTAGAVSAQVRTGADIASRVSAPSSVSLPVAQGQKLGTIVYSADGVVVGRQDLVAARGFGRAGLLTRIGYQVHRAWSWVTSIF